MQLKTNVFLFDLAYISLWRNLVGANRWFLSCGGLPCVNCHHIDRRRHRMSTLSLFTKRANLHFSIFCVGSFKFVAFFFQIFGTQSFLMRSLSERVSQMPLSGKNPSTFCSQNINNEIFRCQRHRLTGMSVECTFHCLKMIQSTPAFVLAYFSLCASSSSSCDFHNI